MTVPVCPVCKRDTYKVSDIVAVGTTTDLASRLAMPPMPTPATEPSLAGSLGLGCFGSWLAWGIIALIGVFALHFGKSGEPYAIGFIVTAIIVSIIVGNNVSKRRQAVAERVHAERMIWDHMRQVWDDLYYCSCSREHGIIFLASDPSKFESADLMNAWLVRQ